jgi:hypothetical protein
VIWRPRIKFNRKLLFAAAAAVLVAGVAASGVALAWDSSPSPATERLSAGQQPGAEASDNATEGTVKAEGPSSVSSGSANEVQPNAATVRSTMRPGDTLARDEELVSKNGRYRVRQLRDGNVVELDGANNPIWSTQSGGHDGAKLIFQKDGNLVVWDGREALWASGTTVAATKLTLQDDGNLVLTNASGKALWGSMQDKTILFPNQVLRAGQSRTSVDGKYSIHMQDDGNLIVYKKGAPANPLWTSQTGARPGAYAVMRADGNLVVYSPDGKTALFNSGNTNARNATLTMLGDGNAVVVRPDNTPVWGTMANGVSLMMPGQWLSGGQWRTSINGRYRLDQQHDGNLVLFDEHQNHRPIWESRTAGNPGAFTRFQTDGNIVTLNAAGAVVWSTATGGRAVKHLAVQDDGNLVLFSSTNEPIWWSRR